MGILEAVDIESHWMENKAMQNFFVPNQDAEADPMPTSADGLRPNPEVSRLSNIIDQINDLFGDFT